MKLNEAKQILKNNGYLLEFLDWDEGEDDMTKWNKALKNPTRAVLYRQKKRIAIK